MCTLTSERMKELIFSLAWYDASSYHFTNTKSILQEAYPGVDFSYVLGEFIKCKTKPPGEGCPR